MNNNVKAILAGVGLLTITFLGFRMYKKSKPVNKMLDEKKSTPTTDKPADKLIDKKTDDGVIIPPPVKKPYDEPGGGVAECRPWTQEEIDMVNSGIGRFTPDFYANRCTPFPTKKEDVGIVEPIGPTKLPVDDNNIGVEFFVEKPVNFSFEKA